MKIEGQNLIKVTNDDISPDGKFSIPGGVTSIGMAAFKGCTKLRSIRIPESLSSIGFIAFEGCTNLASVTMSEGVTSIGTAVFKGCSNLVSVTMSEGVTSIGQCAFMDCTKLTSIRIPKSVSAIGFAAFEGCTNLASVTMSEGVTSIGISAFKGCSELTSITMPKSVSSIKFAAFRNCKSLNHIIIDTIDQTQHDRIKKLIPHRLQSKVLDVENFKAMQKIQFQCLQKLISQPETNPIYQQLARYTTEEEHFLKRVPTDIWNLINQHIKGNSSYHAAAQKEMYALDISHLLTENSQSGYHRQCDVIATKYKELAIKHVENIANIATAKKNSQERQAAVALSISAPPSFFGGGTATPPRAHNETSHGSNNSEQPKNG